MGCTEVDDLLIHPTAGKYAYWDCEQDCCELPEVSYLCHDMVRAEWRNVLDECEGKYSCLLLAATMELNSSSPCVCQGDCNKMETHLSAVMWQCLPGKK